MKKTFVLFLVGVVSCVHAQTKDQFGLNIVGETQYPATIVVNPDNRLVDIKTVIPDIELDIRYATDNNFMGTKMYPSAKAFARKPVANKLKRIQKKLKKMGYGLKIYDAYRPYSVTLAFYANAKDKSFVADPKKGSKHNRGCAIDLTLIDFKTKKELPMPTDFDSFEKDAAVDFMDVSEEVLKNRALLINIMEKHRFKVLFNEWWHFDFVGWEKFDLMDIPFDKL